MSAQLQPRPVLGTPAPWRFPVPTSYTLSNGLTLLTVQLPGKLVATASLLLDLPVDTDPAGQEGLAAMAARCLSEGTASLPAEDFADALDRQGASFRATAGYDGLTATLEVPVSRLGSALLLLADAVMNPAFPHDEVDRVLKQRLAEITQEHASPGARAAIEFAGLLYAPESRTSIPTSGTAASIGSLTAQAISAGYAARASAATASLVVAGDLTGLDVPALVEAALGSWDTKAEPWEPKGPVVGSGPRALVVDRPGSVQTQLFLGQPSGNRTSPHWAAMSLAGYALGGTLTSRIDAVLREEKGYTYGMRGSFTPGRRGGLFTISGSVDTESTGPALHDLMTVLRTAKADGLREDELIAAREYLVGVSPMRWETPSAVAGQITGTIGNDLPVSYVDSYLEGMRTATLEQVTAALRAEVDPEALYVVAVGEASAIVGPLEELGFGTPTVISA